MSRFHNTHQNTEWKFELNYFCILTILYEVPWRDPLAMGNLPVRRVYLVKTEQHQLSMSKLHEIRSLWFPIWRSVYAMPAMDYYPWVVSLFIIRTCSTIYNRSATLCNLASGDTLSNGLMGSLFDVPLMPGKVLTHWLIYIGYMVIRHGSNTRIISNWAIIPIHRPTTYNSNLRGGPPSGGYLEHPNFELMQMHGYNVGR